MVVKSDFRVTTVISAPASTAPPARVHRVDGNLIDVRSYHRAGFPLIVALNASLSVSETGGDGITMPGDRYLGLKVGNGGVGTRAVPVVGGP